jgi:hypothetical protein
LNYQEFLESKQQYGAKSGFNPTFMPSWLFDFQGALSEWMIQHGRSACFADCGLGKTPMQLVWAQNVIEHTNKPVLYITPLAVSYQTVKEAAKFNIDAVQSKDGKFDGKRIIVTNYERLHHFNSSDFGGVTCDESSAIKNFHGKHKAEVTEFMRTVKYRSLWTATAAPNDYIELGTSSEALGELGYMDMLGMFFKNDQNTSSTKIAWRGQGGKESGKFRFKGHAELAFWRWVTSWARAMRRPSDLGYDDSRFILPPLIENEHIVESAQPLPGFLFALSASNFYEERLERRQTIKERCEHAASLATAHNDATVLWCHMNDEGDLMEKMIPGSVQISGKDSDEKKEEAYAGFSDGTIKKLITKPKIGAWGLNWQHCNHVISFASHSYEQYYQQVRRCWRFGQKRPVTVDLIASEGEVGIKNNMRRKAEAADQMFTSLVQEMNNSITINKSHTFTEKVEVPSWL